MELLWTGPRRARHVLLLAHGSGGPMDSPFMACVAEGLGARGVRVGRFEFPYMARRREDGKTRPPDRREKLIEAWREVIAEHGRGAAIGGKSLGGRIASYIADELAVRALVVLGYPYHPPGQPEKQRTEHLQTLTTPALFLQGERDPFGLPEEIRGYALSPSIQLEWIPDGDHAYVPRARSGRTERANLDLAVERVAEFLKRGS